MKITVNGSSCELPEGATISEMLNHLELNARHVAVEVNLELVPRALHGEHRLRERDRLEVVTLVGGG